MRLRHVLLIVPSTDSSKTRHQPASRIQQAEGGRRALLSTHHHGKTTSISRVSFVAACHLDSGSSTRCRKGHLGKQGDVLVHRSRFHRGHLDQRSDVLDHGSRCRIGHLGDWSDVLVHRSQLGQGSDVLDHGKQVSHRSPRGLERRTRPQELQLGQGSRRFLDHGNRCRREHHKQRSDVLVDRYPYSAKGAYVLVHASACAAENTSEQRSNVLVPQEQVAQRTPRSKERRTRPREQVPQRTPRPRERRTRLRRSRCRRGHLYHRHDVLVHGIKREIAENDQPASLLQQAERGRRALLSTHHIRRRRHFELLLNDLRHANSRPCEQFNVLLRTNMYTLASRRPCVLGTHALQLGSRRLLEMMMMVMKRLSAGGVCGNVFSSTRADRERTLARVVKAF